MWHDAFKKYNRWIISNSVFNRIAKNVPSQSKIILLYDNNLQLTTANYGVFLLVSSPNVLNAALKQKNPDCKKHFGKKLVWRYINIHQLQMVNQSPLFKSLVDHAPFAMIGWSIWLALLQTIFLQLTGGIKKRNHNFFWLGWRNEIQILKF